MAEDNAEYVRGVQVGLRNADKGLKWLREQLDSPQPPHWSNEHTAGFDAALKLLIAAKESDGYT